MSRTIELLAGLLLLIVGVLLLASEPLADFVGGLGIDEDVLRWWPILIIGLSLFFLVPALIGGANRRLRAGMVIPGALLAGIGSALLYMSLTDRWEAWVYLWSVFPFSLGLGMYAAGWIADAPAFKWIGTYATSAVRVPTHFLHLHHLHLHHLHLHLSLHLVPYLLLVSAHIVHQPTPLLLHILLVPADTVHQPTPLLQHILQVLAHNSTHPVQPAHLQDTPIGVQRRLFRYLHRHRHRLQ